MLTGATGFIGNHLLNRLLSDTNYKITAAVRSEQPKLSPSVNVYTIKYHISDDNWLEVLKNVDIVIHCAAQTEAVSNSSSTDEFIRNNSLATSNLAKFASLAGVKRFIYLSSIKVNGEETKHDIPFRREDIPRPTHIYGMSKLISEFSLISSCASSEMEFIIIRPPVVYGPNVKGNILRLYKHLENGYPLPFGSICKNRRSLISVTNLVDFIITCIHHKDAGNDIYLVSDNDDVSTAELVEKISKILPNPGINLPLNIKVIELVAKLCMNRDFVSRTCGSLYVDISYTQSKLGWLPKINLSDGLKEILQ